MFDISQFRRITTSSRFVPIIDGFRFVAIFSVILLHVMDLSGARSGSRLWFENGARGVQVFFAISGFILALPFMRAYGNGASVSIKKFFTRRLTRLEPPYILNMALLFVLLTTWKHTPGLTAHLIASLLYLHGAVFHSGSFLNYAAWSLEVEIQFYCLVPVIAQAFKIREVRTRRLLLALGIIGFSAYGSLANRPWEIHFFLVSYLQYFLSGVLLADVYLNDWKESPKQNWRYDLISVAAWVAIFWVGGLIGYLAEAPLIFVAFAASMRSIAVKALLTYPLVTAIGGMCYSIYLYHYITISAVGKLLPRRSPTSDILILGALSIPAAILFSAAMYLLIEKPCMRPDWPNRLVAAFSSRNPFLYNLTIRK